MTGTVRCGVKRTGQRGRRGTLADHPCLRLRVTAGCRSRGAARSSPFQDAAALSPPHDRGGPGRMPGHRSWTGHPRRPWAFRCHGNRREQVRRDGSAVGGLHACAGREAGGPKSGARKAGRSYEVCWTSRPPLGPMKASRIGVPMRSMCDRDEDERYALGLEASRFPWSRWGIAGKFHAPSPIGGYACAIWPAGESARSQPGTPLWPFPGEEWARDVGRMMTTGTSAQAAQATSLRKAYGAGQAAVRATRRERHVRTRPVHGRHGPSGSGKSTLMHCRAGRPCRRRGDGRCHGPHQLRLPHPHGVTGRPRRCREAVKLIQARGSNREQDVLADLEELIQDSRSPQT